MFTDSTCVHTANGEFEAQQVKAFLEANGVICELRGEALRNTHGLTLDGLGCVKIHVATADAERVRELMAQVEAGELTLTEDVDPVE